jgi:hypothetical protein
MSTFDWGFDASQAGGQMIPQDVGFVLQEELRKSQTTAFLTPQNASATAQNATGLGIQNIKRGYLNLVIPYDSSVVGIDFQTSSTSFVDVSTELRGSVATSGRPVAIFLRAFAGSALVTVAIDGREVTGVQGVMTGAMGQGHWFAQPSAGSHTYAMQWKVNSGTQLMTRESRPSLTVVEL